MPEQNAAISDNSRDNLMIYGGALFGVNKPQIAAAEMSGNGELTSLGDDAFAMCENLGTVNFDNCGELRNIGNQAFGLCGNLTKASFVGCGSLESIGESAFYKDGKLAYADFENCTRLRIVKSGAFFECKNLISLSFSGCTALQRIESYALSGCENLMSIDLSDCRNLTFIAKNAFADCKKLYKIKLPKHFFEAVENDKDMQKYMLKQILGADDDRIRRAEIDLFDGIYEIVLPDRFGFNDMLGPIRRQIRRRVEAQRREMMKPENLKKKRRK